jgi:hypothetical protein
VSARWTLGLTCDRCGVWCEHEASPADPHNYVATLQAVRERAARDGWKSSTISRTYTDLCPACRAPRELVAP